MKEIRFYALRHFAIALLASSAISGCNEEQKTAQAQNIIVAAQSSAQAANRNSLRVSQINEPSPAIATKIELGIDSNGNGVWDDVDQYINSRFKEPEKAKAMRQLAVAIQNALNQNDTKAGAKKTVGVWLRALDCVDEKLGEAWYHESKLLTAEMLKSEARSIAHATHQSNSAGIYSSEKGKKCDD